MKAFVFSIMWNNEYILPYFLRHYSTFAERIFIFNDHSTDKTVEIAKENPKVTLLDFEYDRGLNEDDFNDCFEQAYKKYARGKADWVMCVDADELIYNKQITKVLEQQNDKAVRVLKSPSYQMISKTFPKTDGQIYDECKTGIRSPRFDKTVVFDPALDITFGPGRHSINLPESIKAADAGLLMLHYKYLSRDFIIERNKIAYPRYYGMSERDRNYRTRRALDTYDSAINSQMEIVVQ